MNIREIAKRIWTWFLSNLIWTILMVPAALLIPILKNMSVIINKTYTIKLYHIIFVVVFFILEIIFAFFLIKRKTNNNSESADSHKQNEYIEDSYDSIDDFYFENYTKHVTVYKEGHGIIINTFDIKINNKENFKEIKRKLNIEDGKTDAIFPKLSVMKQTNSYDRFNTVFGYTNHQTL